MLVFPTLRRWRRRVWSMTIGEPKMTEMSKPAEIFYRAFFDELRFCVSGHVVCPEVLDHLLQQHQVLLAYCGHLYLPVLVLKKISRASMFR